MFTYNTDDLVINMLPGDRLTVGKTYRVVNSYDGHFGCGAQEWCRIADDNGVVSGFDPDRFIPAAVGDFESKLKTVLKVYRRLTKLIEETPRDGVLKELHTKLSDMLSDVAEIVASTAIAPAYEQFILNEIDQGRYEVRVNQIVIAHLNYQGGRYEATFVNGEELPLKSINYPREAFAYVKDSSKARFSGWSAVNDDPDATLLDWAESLQAKEPA